MATWPGHKYLGPGNNLDVDAPLDSADLNALEHDVDYEFAINNKQVFSADRRAISHFGKDLVSELKNFNFSAALANLAGTTGLYIKNSIEEDLLGTTLYPWHPQDSMTSSTNFGNILYALREKTKSLLYRKIKSDGKTKKSYRDFYRSEGGLEVHNQICDYYRTNGAYYTELKRTGHLDIEALSNGLVQDHYNLWTNENQFFFDSEGDSSQNICNFNDLGVSDKDYSSPNNSETTTPVDQTTGSGTSEATGNSTGNKRISSNLPSTSGEPAKKSRLNSSSANSNTMSPGGSNMDTTSAASASVDRGGATGTGTTPTNVGAGSSGGRGPAAGGNGPNIAGMQFSKSVQHEEGSVTFHKSRIMFSHGIAHRKLTLDAKNSGIEKPMHGIVTSLAYIPVDWLPFYLTPQEYANLPVHAKVLHVDCKVTPVGCRTAFDHGGTQSGSATQEWIPIGRSAIGLNNKFSTYNSRISSVSTEPMIPVNVSPVEPEKLIGKYYSLVDGATMGIPIQIDEYNVILQNKDSEAAGTDVDYSKHIGGLPRYDKIVNRFLFNGKIGEPIINYSYCPQNSILKETKRANLPYIVAKRGIKLGKHIGPFNLDLKGFKNANYAGGTAYINSCDADLEALWTPHTSNYKRMLESGPYSFNLEPCRDYSVQPQVHVGLILRHLYIP